LLRPNEAAILEVIADSNEPLSLSVEMVSADMSIFYQRKRRLPPFLEFSTYFAGSVIPPFAVASLTVFSIPVIAKASIWIIAFVVFAALFTTGQTWVTRLQKAITPPMVWQFF
jgi:hypothetical protein